MQANDLFPPERSNTIQGLRISTRLPWLFLSGILVVVALTLANALFAYWRDSDLLRQNLETADRMQALAIAEMLREPVSTGDWGHVQAALLQMAGTLPGKRLRITGPDGSPLADSQGIEQRGPAGATEARPVEAPAGEKTWLSPNGVLQVQAAITNERGLAAAVFMMETHYEDRFRQMMATSLARMGSDLVGALLLGAAILLASWKLFLDPLNRIYQIANAVQQGNRTVRMPDSNVMELRRIARAFNAMIEHLAQQHTELETLNRNLEATVAERTTALETSSTAIRKRADQVEAINKLVASTAGTIEMQSLVSTALEVVVNSLQAEIGGLQIYAVSARVGIELDLVESLYQIAFDCRITKADRLVIADWRAIGQEEILFPLAQALEAHQIRSSVVVPIVSNEVNVGMLGLASHRAKAWTGEEVALLEIISHHLATVAERIASVENLKEHNTLMRQMVAQSERLNRTFTPLEVIAMIGEGAQALSQADQSAVFVNNAAGNIECAWLQGTRRTEASAGSTAAGEDWVKPIMAGVLESYTQSKSTGQPADLKARMITDLETQMDDLAIPEIAQGERIRSIGVWPLVYENQASAYVVCGYSTPKAWKPNEQEVLEAFFRQAAAALENARLFAAECEQRRLSEALRDVAATLSSSLELDEVLDGILSNLGRVVPHSTALVMLLENDILRPARWQGMPAEQEEPLRNWRYSVRQLANRQQMLETMQALVIPDTAQSPNWVWTTGLEWVRSYAGAPICQHGVVTGFIDVMSPQPGFYDAKTASIMEAFANQAAIALENARLYYNSQQRMAETSALYRAVMPLFNPVENIEALARGIAESVTKEFSSAHCSILLLNENRTHLQLIAQAGTIQLNAPDLPLKGPGLTVMAVLTGKTVYSADVHQEPNYVYGGAITRSELAIPLQAGGQVFGAMNLESPDVDAFDERGRRLLVSFAEQAALGLENARLFATIRENAHEMEQLNAIAQRRAQEAETIRKATTALSSTLDMQGVLDRILDQMELVVPHDSASMFLVEDDQRLRVWAAKNLMIGEATYYPRSNFLFTEIEESMRPVALDDVMADERFCDWEGTNLVRSWMGVPLLRGSELVGILTLDRYSFRPFRPEEMELAQAFANQAAIAVQNARLYEATQQRARELEALHTATTSLVSTLDLQKLLERILGSAASAIPAARAATLHLLDEAGEMHLRVQQGLDSEVESPEWNARNQLWNWVINERQPTLVSNLQHIEDLVGGNGFPRSWQSGSLLVTPLLQEDHPLGLITLFSPEAGAFAERDLHLLISFASTATAAIQNAQLHSAVQHMAITDPLTNLFNRRGFFRLAKMAMEKSGLLERPVSFIMIDIDFFKNINDRYGHDAGDIVLQILAKRSRQALREMDLVCRYGGEEFAILLPESDMSGAQAAASRVFKSITETPMETPSGPVSVTISVGVATSGEDCTNLDQLIKRADQALYLAKGLGRNQVQMWQG